MDALPIFFVALLSRLADWWMLAPAFVAIELLWSRGPTAWLSRLRGAALQSVFIVATAASLAAFVQVRVSPALVPNLPGWVLAIGSLLAGDLVFYWFHRAQHAIPFLWRFHAVHHAIRDLSAVNAYEHWTENIFRQALVGLPVAMLMPGGDSALAGTISLIAAAQALFSHSSTRLNFGPLGRVVIDNRFHRVHHSRDGRHWNKNFGAVLGIWDCLFGTAVLLAPNEWPDVGLHDRGEPRGLGDYLLASKAPV